MLRSSGAWNDPRLQRDWLVVIQDGIALRFEAVISRLVEVLVVLESAGLPFTGINWLHESWRPSPDLPPVGSELDSARIALRDLHVELARSPTGRTDAQGGEINFMFVVAPGASQERLNQLVVERIEAKIDKLRRTPADARHLFIWLEPSEAQAHLAASVADELPGSPAVPEGLDVVWLATRYFPTFNSVDVRGVTLLKLWKLVPAEDWQQVSLSPFCD